MTVVGGPPNATAVSREWSEVDELRLRASLLAFFELPWLGPLADSPLIDQLLQDCHRIAGPDGVRHWTLPDSARRDTLRAAGLTRARDAWRALAHRPDTAEQSVIDRCVGHGQFVSVETASARELQAVQAVTRWLNVLDVPLPAEWELSTRAGREAMLGPLRKLAGPHFVGRSILLARLANDLRYTSGITLIHGIGGIGKSAIAAQHVLNAVRIGALTCYLTFDQGNIDPNQPVSILAAMCRQLAVQLDEEPSRKVSTLADRAIENQRRGGRRHESAGRDLNVVGDLVTTLLRELSAEVGERRCLLVIDALEEAQRRGEPAVLALLGFIEAVTRLLGSVQVLLLGRAPIDRATSGKVEQVRLQGLDFTDAVGLLEALLADLGVQPGPSIDAPAAIEQVGTSPLCIHLAAGVLAKAPQDRALRDLALTRGAVEGELYRRLLGHIGDPDVRKLAHPGLTLRKVSPELIRHVLAGPCELIVPDDETARRLFEKLAAEAMLVSRAPGSSEVVHRPDIRALMLERLAEDAAEVMGAIHRAAVQYYLDREQPADRVEELYHRLMMNQTADTLDSRWQDHVLPGLLPSMDEMPAASRAYLAQRAGVIDISDRDLVTTQRTTQRELVIRRVRRLVTAGLVGEARAELQRHQEETQDRSPDLEAVWVEVLELQGDVDGALQRAEAERAQAGKRGANQDLFTFTLHTARLLERMDRQVTAAQELDGALDLARQLPDNEPYRLLRLRLITARLGLARRTEAATSDALVEEAINAYGTTSPKVVASTPGLLRDLAAEVGQGSSRILRHALNTLGLQADAAQLASTLASWDAAESAAQGARSGRLANLARVAQAADGDYDWQGWASAMSPGRLGERLSELEAAASVVPQSVIADLVRFYQRESDVAVAGFAYVTGYEFVGRDADISQIESRMSLTESNELLVHGMIGVGKTSLLSQISSYWLQTGVVERVFRFDRYQLASGDSDDILNRIGTALPKPASRLDDEDLSENRLQARVIQILRANNYVMVLDDLDWALHGVEGEARQKFATLLSQLRGGRTRVLLGTRDPGIRDLLNIPESAVYALEGLDQHSSSVLTERILRRNDVDQFLSDPVAQANLIDFLAMLDGSPLCLNLLLPGLARTSLSDIIDSINSGDVRADPVGNARRVVQESYDRLNQSAQQALLLLCPFNGAIYARSLAPYQDFLPVNKDIQISDAGDFTDALSQAVATGLAAWHPSIEGLIKLHPILPYFLRNKLRNQPQTRFLADRAHYRLYTVLGSELGNLLESRDPEERTFGIAFTDAEYFNLSAALRYAVQTGEHVTPLIRPIDGYLARQQPVERRRERWEEIITPLSSGEHDVSHEELAYLYLVASNAAVEAQDFTAARNHAENALRLYQDEGDQRGAANSLFNLGRLAQRVGDLGAAEQSYSQALSIFSTLGDQYGAGLVQEQLGRAAHQQGDYQEAEAAYRQAISLSVERGDSSASASALFNLGRLLTDQGRLAEAEASCRQALDIFLKSGERHSAASAYRQLGKVAEEQARFADAEASYRQALDIFLEFRDRQSLGATYGRLGRVAQEQGRFDEAEAAYRQALDIELEFGDRRAAAVSYYQLGTVAQQQDRLAEAEAAYRQAFELFLESDPRNASMTGTRIGLLLAEVGRHVDAATMLIDAAMLWQQVTGGWDPGDLRYLRDEVAIIGQDEFGQLVTAKVPSSLQKSLYSGVAGIEDA